MESTIARPFAWWERLGERMAGGLSVEAAAAAVAPTLSDSEVKELCFGFAEAHLLHFLSPDGESYLPAYDRISRIADVIREHVVNACDGEAAVRAMLADSQL